jgi:hypothetical protein
MPDAGSLDPAVLAPAIREAKADGNRSALVDLRRIPARQVPPGLAEELASTLGVPVESPYHAGAVGARTFPVGPDGERTPGVFSNGYRTVPAGSQPPPPVSYPMGDGWVADEVGRSVFLHPSTGTPASLLVQVARAAAASERPVIFIDSRQAPPGTVWAATRQAIDGLRPEVVRRVSFQPVAPDDAHSTVDTHRSGAGADPDLAAYHQKVLELRSGLAANATAAELADFADDLHRFLLEQRGAAALHPDLALVEKGDPVRTAGFDYVDWQVQLSTELVDPASQPELSQDELTDQIAAALLHEWEHVGQYRDIARYLAARPETAADLAAVFPTKKTEVLDAARREPLPRGEFERAGQLYQHAFGSGQEQRRAVEERLATTRAAAERAEAARRGDVADPYIFARLELDVTRTRIDHARALAAYASLPLEVGAYQREAELARLSGAPGRRPAALHPKTPRREPVTRPPIATRTSQPRPVTVVGRADPGLAGLGRRLTGLSRRPAWLGAVAVNETEQLPTTFPGTVGEVQNRLTLPNSEVDRMARLLGLDTDDEGRERAAGAAHVRHLLAGRPGFAGDDGLHAAYDILSLMREGFPAELSGPSGSLDLANLGRLARRLLADSPAGDVAALASLAEPVRLARLRGVRSRLAVRVADRQRRLGLDEDAVVAHGRTLGVDASRGGDPGTWMRVVEAVGLRAPTVGVPGLSDGSRLVGVDQLASLMAEEFEVDMTDLDRPLETADLLPLVHAVLDRRAKSVSPDHLTGLVDRMRAARAAGEPSLGGLRVADLQVRLGLDDDDVTRLGWRLGLDSVPEYGVQRWQRTLEAAALHEAMGDQAELAGPAGLRSMDRLLVALRRNYPSHVREITRISGRLEMDSLLPMVRAVIDTDATSVRPADVAQLAGLVETATGDSDWSVSGVRLRRHATDLSDRLSLTGAEADTYRQTLKVEPTPENRARTLQAVELHRAAVGERAELAGPEGLVAAHHVMTLSREHFGIAPTAATPTLADLEPMLKATVGSQATVGPQASATPVPADLGVLVTAARMALEHAGTSLAALSTAVDVVKAGVTTTARADEWAGEFGLPPGIDSWRRVVEADRLYESIKPADLMSNVDDKRAVLRLIDLLREHTPARVPKAPEPVTATELLALVQDVLNPRAAAATLADARALSDVIEEAAGNDVTSPLGLRAVGLRQARGVALDDVHRWGREWGRAAPDNYTRPVAALLLRRAAGLTGAHTPRLADQMLTLLRDNFGDQLPADRLLVMANLLPLYHATVDSGLVAMTGPHARELAAAVRLAAEESDLTVPAVKAAAAVRSAASLLDLTEDGVRRLRDQLGLTGVAGLVRAVEAEGMRQGGVAQPGVSAEDGLRAAHRLTNALRAISGRTDALAGPVTVGDLLPLVQSILDLAAGTVSPQHVHHLSTLVESAGRHGEPSTDLLRAARRQEQLGLSDADVTDLADQLSPRPPEPEAWLRVLDAEWLRHGLGLAEETRPAIHQLLNLLWDNFAGDLSGPSGQLGVGDLAPLARSILDRDVQAATAVDVAALVALVQEALGGGDARLWMVRAHAVHARLGLSDEDVRATGQILDIDTTFGESGWAWALVTHDVQDQVAGQAALAGPDGRRAIAQMLTLMLAHFPDAETVQLARLEPADLAPLARSVLDGDFPTVTAADVATLAAPVLAALDAGDASLPAVRAHAVRARLGMPDDDLLQTGTVLAVDASPGTDGWVQVLHALDLQAQAQAGQPALAGPAGLRAIHQMLTLVPDLPGHTAVQPGRWGMQDLAPLVRLVLDRNVQTVTAADLAALVTPLREARAAGEASVAEVWARAAAARLGLAAGVLEEAGRSMDIDVRTGLANRVQVLEALELQRKAMFYPGAHIPRDVLAFGQTLDLLRTLLRDRSPAAPTPRTAWDLLPLVRAVVDPAATTVTPVHVGTLAAAVAVVRRSSPATVLRDDGGPAVQRQQRLDRLKDAATAFAGAAVRPTETERLTGRLSFLDGTTEQDRRWVAGQLLNVMRTDLARGIEDERVPLAPKQLLPLVQVTIDRRATGVTDEHLARLAGLALDGRRRGVRELSLPALYRLMTASGVQEFHDLSEARVGELRRRLGLADDFDGWWRTIEAVNLAVAVQGTDALAAGSNSDWVRPAHRVLSLTRKNFKDHVAGVPGLLDLPDLLPLVRRAVRPDLTTVRPADVAAIFAVPARVPGTAPSLSTLEWHFRRAASNAGADAQANRDRELRDLRENLPEFADSRLKSRPNLRALMRYRRENQADVRVRMYTGLDVYRPLAREMLGENHVDGAVLEKLADLVLRVRRDTPARTRAERRGRMFEITRSGGDRRFVRRRKPGPQVTGERLAALARELHWSKEVQEGPEGLDVHNLAVPGQQYPVHFAHFDEMVEWLNGLTPGGPAGLRREDVLSALVPNFNAALDDGVPYRVKVAGREYLIDLHAVVAAGPGEDLAPATKAPAKAKLEQRINSIELESGESRQSSWNAYLDVAFVNRFGNWFPVTATVPWTAGHSWGGSRQYTQGAGAGRYAYQKPDDTVAPMAVTTTWWVRLTDVETGRQRISEWTGPAGQPRQAKVTTLVSKPLLPQPGPVNRKALANNEELPLHEMHHLVERMRAAERLRTNLRKLIGAEEYDFFREPVELWLSNDRLSGWYSGALRGHDALRGAVTEDRYEALREIPRLTLRRDGRFLNVALTAEALGFQEIGAATSGVKFDRVRQGVGKASATRERPSGVRASLPVSLRVLGSIVSFSPRLARTRVRFKQWSRTRNNWLLRVMRASDESQVLNVDNVFTLHAEWGSDPGKLAAARSKVGAAPEAGARRSARSAPIPGWAQVRVRTTELNNPARQPDATKKWWSLGPDHGLGLGTIRKITQLHGLYNGIVPELVRLGFLPSEALGPLGTRMTPVEALAELPVTNGALNKPEVAYENWRRLLDEMVSPSIITGRSDDEFGGTDGQPGTTLRLSHPDGSTITLGISGTLDTEKAVHLHTDTMMPVNTYIGMEETGIRRGERVNRDAAFDIGIMFRGDLEPTAPVPSGSPPPKPKHSPPWHTRVPLGGSGGYGWRWGRGQRTGEKSSSTINAYVRTTGNTNLFSMPLKLRWSLYDGLAATPEVHETTARVEAYQPESLTGDAGHRDVPPLTMTDERGTEITSPLRGLVPRTTVSATGFGALQRSMIDQRRHRALEVRPGNAAPSTPTGSGVRPTRLTRAGRYARRVTRRGGGLVSAVGARLPSDFAKDRGRAALPQEIRERRQTIQKQVWDGLSPIHYKTNLPRLLSSGVGVMIGADQGTMRADPVGKPQVLRKIKVYTEIVQESQAGLDQEKERNRGRSWRGVFGYRPGLPTGSGSAGYGRSKGRKSRADLSGWTAGLYRSLTNTSFAYVVRTAVVNRVEMEDGTAVEEPGEVVFLVDESHMHQAEFDKFDDPNRVLPAQRPQPPRPTREAPRSLLRGRFWGGGWTAPIGTGPLHDKLTTHARELGGDELAVQVAPLLTWIESKLPQMNDGGHTWSLNAGGEEYRLIMTAAKEGDPEHLRDLPAAGLKEYTRQNFTTNTRFRVSRARVRNIATFGKRLTDRAYVTISGSANQTRSKETTRQFGTNLLTMDGERPKGMAEFKVPIRFRYRLVHVPRHHNLVARMGSPRMREGDALEHRFIHVPLDGSPLLASDHVGWAGRPRDWLPAQNVVVHGVHGLAGIDRAARRQEGSRFRRLSPDEATRLAAGSAGKAKKRGSQGPPVPGQAVLTREALLADLRTMLAGGRRYASVTTAEGQTTLPKGMTVEASFGQLDQIYFVREAEMEHYDHGTRTVASGEQTSTRTDGYIQFEFRSPTADPNVDLGVRVTGGGDRGETLDPGGLSMATEHRSWLRLVGSAYHLSLPVTFTIRTGGRWYSRPQIVHGYVEVSMTEEGVAAMGIPPNVVKAAKDAAEAHKS